MKVIQKTPANWGYFDLDLSSIIEINNEYSFEALIRTNATWTMEYSENISIVKVNVNSSNDSQKIILNFTPTVTNLSMIRWFNNVDGCYFELYSLNLCKR